jgi:hypothetical protein
MFRRLPLKLQGIREGFFVGSYKVRQILESASVYDRKKPGLRKASSVPGRADAAVSAIISRACLVCRKGIHRTFMKI